jgi:hypothetical protein
MKRVCILDPMALACVALAGVCLGLIVWGASIGHLGQMIMAGLVGALLAWIAWRLGAEQPGVIIFERDAFWRTNLAAEPEITSEGLDTATADPAPHIARSETP